MEKEDCYYKDEEPLTEKKEFCYGLTPLTVLFQRKLRPIKDVCEDPFYWVETFAYYLQGRETRYLRQFRTIGTFDCT